MNIFYSILLGVIEGVTEFLPVSSTAHLIVAGDLFRIPQTEFLKTFEVVIQLGAILAIVVLYGKDFIIKKQIAFKVLAAFIPTAIIGFVLHQFIKDVLFESTTVILASLFLGGIILIAFEQWHTEKKTATKDVEDITYKQAVVIGLFQSIAVVPGVSRAAATIIGGLVMDVKRDVIVRFSFLLAVPTMVAATVLDLSKASTAFTTQEYAFLGTGFVVAFITALIVVRWFLGYLKTHTFTGFGIYRICAAIIGWLLLR